MDTPSVGPTEPATSRVTTPGQQPSHRATRNAVIATIAAVTVVVVTAVGAYVYRQATKTVIAAGEVVLIDTDPTKTKFTWQEDPMSCLGEDLFADIKQGTSVVVADEDGHTLAVGALGSGKPAGFEQVDLGQFGFSERADRCIFQVESFEVPEREFYRVSVGRQQPVMVPNVTYLQLRYGG